MPIHESAADVSRTIERWCDAEFRAWDSDLTFETVRTRLRAEARRNLAICLYRIDDGTVEFHPDVRNMSHLMDPAVATGWRAHKYLEHLRDAVRIFGVKGTAPIGIFMADLYVDRLSAPVFFFQKPVGSRGLMIPDIDFLVHNYNLDGDGRFNDTVPFDDKDPRAIFVGSTTGDYPLTRRLIDEGRNTRVDAARFFRDRNDVVFELPNICQYDDEDTLAFLRSLDIGGPHRDWAEQQRYRYQISIDGNGATCGRVAIALHSRSTLLKYASLNTLYYFHGLEAWRHYIPLDGNGAVLDVIADAGDFGSLHRSIAAESRRFAQTYLSRHSILKYTAHMLTRYIARFGRGGGPLRDPHDEPIVDAAFRYRESGPVWSDPGAAAGQGDRPIEGCFLFPTGGIAWSDLSYRGVDADSSLTPVAGGGQYCCSATPSVPLHGVAVRLDGGATPSRPVVVTERFADGHVRRTASPREPRFHPAPLTGLHVAIEPG